MNKNTKPFVAHQSPSLKKWMSHFAVAGVSFLSILGIIALQLPRVREITEGQLSPEVYQRQAEIAEVNVSLLKKIPSFGFDNLVAGWTMLRFIQYFGDGEAREETNYALSPDYLEAIIQHDPRFVLSYLIISPVSSMYAARPDRTVALMEEGLPHLSPEIPNAYFVWLYKGTDELLFLGDIEAAKQSYQMASQWAKLAGNEAIAQTAQKTVQSISTNPESEQVQISAWAMVLGYVPDDYTRRLAIENIQRLGGQVQVNAQGEFRVIPPET